MKLLLASIVKPHSPSQFPRLTIISPCFRSTLNATSYGSRISLLWGLLPHPPWTKPAVIPLASKPGSDLESVLTIVSAQYKCSAELTTCPSPPHSFRYTFLHRMSPDSCGYGQQPIRIRTTLVNPFTRYLTRPASLSPSPQLPSPP